MRELKAGDWVYIRKDFYKDKKSKNYTWVKEVKTGWRKLATQLGVNFKLEDCPYGFICMSDMVDWVLTDAYNNLKPGDMVYIREDLIPLREYNGYSFVDGMSKGWQRIKENNKNGFYIEADFYNYSPEMVDWVKTLAYPHIEEKIPVSSIFADMTEKIVKYEGKHLRKQFTTGSNLYYDGTILEGTIDDRVVVVKRSEKDSEDLEKAVMMALLKSLGFRYEDVSDIVKDVKTKWKPQEGEDYYSFTYFDGFEIKKFRYIDDDIDKQFIKSGNCFKTREEANRKVEKIKAILKGE